MAATGGRWWGEGVAWHELGGADASKVLNNLSTQELLRPAVGEALWAAFVDHKGLHLDLWQAFRHAGGWWAEGMPEQAEAMQAWVDRHVITEELTHAVAQAEAFRAVGEGPEAWAQAQALGAFPQRGLLAEAPEAWAWWEGPEAGLRLVAASGEGDRLRAWLTAQGWGEAEAGAAEAWRVAQGRPAWASELQGRNPWACRLDQAVALAKGCYLGQEVIARLHHYAKVPQGLVGVAGVGLKPAPGAKLAHASGRPGGALSSVVGQDGDWQGLAFASATLPLDGLSLEGQAVAAGDRPFWAGKAEPLATRAAGLVAPAPGPA